MEKQLVEGRWYKTTMGSYFKFREIRDKIIRASEYFIYDDYSKLEKDGNFGYASENNYTSINISEITKLLPLNHPDLKKKSSKLFIF